jgi:beta-phosphoglucomutase
VSSPLAFLFDMDGVIIDSTSMHVEAWNRYLGTYGRTVPNLANRMLGRHNADLVRDLFSGQELTEIEISDHGARKEALYREMMAPVFQSKLVPGAADFITRHRGCPMAVATNAELANVDFVLDLDIYLRAASLLGVAPEDCIVFEDSTTGVDAAHAAGMRVVGLLTTLTRFDNVELEIRSFADIALEEWLSSLRSSASSRC